ncbi:MAG: cobalt transporter, ATPase subunit [Oscillospiraceae bacterium]|nr:cobalt transporter, ATPase subunit [Oscillospiraceae bacterium]
MTQPESLLELRSISYSYGNGEPALRGISVSIRTGERIALLGNNGAGKSTFFLCCNGVLKPQSGSVLLNGTVVSNKKRDLAELRRHVGIVFQDPDHQIIASTVESEVSFGPMNLGLPKSQVAGRLDAALKAMNLEAMRTRPPHYLSGGEKKRVSIADILAMEPSLILLDEPTAGLDCAHTVRLEETMAALHRQGMAMLVSTHDVNFAWRFADRILVLSKGDLIADAPAAEVFSQTALLQQAGLEKPAVFALSEALGIHPIPRTMEELTCQIRQSS